MEMLEDITRFDAILILMGTFIFCLFIVCGIILFIVSNLGYSSIQHRLESIFYIATMVCGISTLIIGILFLGHLLITQLEISKFITELLTFIKGVE